MNKQINIKAKRLNTTTRKVLAIISVPMIISAYLMWITGISAMLPVLLIVPFVIIYTWWVQKTNIVIYAYDENIDEEQELEAYKREQDRHDEREITIFMGTSVTLTIIALLSAICLDKPLCTGITGMAVGGIFLIAGWFLFHDYF